MQSTREDQDDSASSVSFSASELVGRVQEVPLLQPPPVGNKRHQSLQHPRPTRRVSIQIPEMQNVPEIPRRESGGRTISTAVRLSRQGFRPRTFDGHNFAVRSIRRGSDDWHNLIKPFCADIVFKSLITRRYHSEVSFVPYTCHAAVLFIDLSGYSKISSAIASKGAHALSSVVNSYLHNILQIVHANGGDVVKFAGDAVLVLWEGQRQELEINIKCAARCAMSIQRDAASHPVDPERDLYFRNHIGLCCGEIESEVFEARTHVTMQKLFHSVGGEALSEISEVVDMARAGEVCISSVCLQYIKNLVEVRDVCPSKTDLITDSKILVSFRVDALLEGEMEQHIENTLLNRICRHDHMVEENFIHPSVLRQLSHGGVDPTQIAQIRNLCVLFIAMTSGGSSVNWLMEVQGLLDRHRCPIVQILKIDDDKGVHIVSAVNLYEAIPEASLLGLNVVKELMENHVGCAIGMAMGATFCGVTGSGSLACRWDITGPPPVRAARLMQYCLTNDETIAIDHSVYNDPLAAVRLKVLHAGVVIKGTDDLCPIYTLSQSTKDCAFRVLETVHGSIHDEQVRQIQGILNGPRSRMAVVVTGPTLAGKKIVCQRAAGYANLAPYLHICEENGGLLQLAKTIATWFMYVEHEEVKRRASDVLEFLLLQHWTQAHDECIKLVSFALENGMEMCFLVDRFQFLDEFSFSLIRECLHGRVRLNRLAMSSRSMLERKSSSASSLRSSESMIMNDTGRLAFLCTHVPLYNCMDACDLVSHLTRDHRNLNVPVIEVLQSTKEELRTLMRDMIDMKVGDRWLDTYSESAGFCAGYFIERAAASRRLSSALWSQGKKGYAVTTEKVELHIPPGFIGMNKHMTVHQTSPEVVMRFAQVYDALPPLFQTVCKVLAIATRQQFFCPSKDILWQVLNDLVANGIELHVLRTVLDEMESMFLVQIKTTNDGEELIAFLNPAFIDIVGDVCTPTQVNSVVHALIERLGAVAEKDFRVSLVLATLYKMAGLDNHLQKKKWKEGFVAFQKVENSFSPKEQVRWLELMQDEIREAGFDVESVLGGDFCCCVPHKKSIGSELPLLKIYQGPVSMGEMSHALAVLTLNTFHEYENFHGASRAQRRRLDRASSSASSRYLKMMDCLETFLAGYGLGAPENLLKKEREIILYVAHQATSEEEVVNKATRVLNELVPQVIQPRMKRLHALVEKLRKEKGTPEIVLDAEPAIRRAYEALQSDTNRLDAAQDALMIMATMNWKPTPTPEQMGILYQQTVARIRNKVLKLLTPSELIGFKHQQTIDDLEAFLIVTPLFQKLTGHEYVDR